VQGYKDLALILGCNENCLVHLALKGFGGKPWALHTFFLAKTKIINCFTSRAKAPWKLKIISRKVNFWFSNKINFSQNIYSPIY